MKIISYINSLDTMEFAVQDVVEFAKEAQRPNRHVVWIHPDDLKDLKMADTLLPGGAAVIWEGEEGTYTEVVELFKKEW